MFTNGQRWISDSEPELGLGTVTEAGPRRVALDFVQSGENRLYAIDHAPLTRILFQPGDEVQDRGEKPYQVISLREESDLIYYRLEDLAKGEVLELPESALSDRIALHLPLTRLLAGQVDKNSWFQLRKQSLEAAHFISKSPLLGLCSGRTELIPHQLYIADEVSQRYAPRVLLADEVGLGKTIEAGMIVQQQLGMGLVNRLLILVPEPLLHQWLLEMLRRFNLKFSLFDETRCQSLEQEAPGSNPFLSEQMILCPLDLLSGNATRAQQLTSVSWDMVLVDEAHRLLFENHHCENVQSHHLYRHMEVLSRHSKGLLLLTATPDQLGQENHFALLRLLDPQRFHDLAAFRREQEKFTAIAATTDSLLSLTSDTPTAEIERSCNTIKSLLQDPPINELCDALLAGPNRARKDQKSLINQIVQAILDRHGTGRVLFRNARKSISGFPTRTLRAKALSLPSLYRDQRSNLTPEQACSDQQWLSGDPRVSFICELLQELGDEKVLLICARAETAAALEAFLRLRRGMKSALFHEGMSLLERDRAAAYFADPDEGARILICSEIGSEGRNFQFSHHLILFDLPLNADLLEQRIGRLDRIGQKHDVQIHVPFLEDSAQALLFRWYQEGMQAFERTNSAAYLVSESNGEELQNLIRHPESWGKLDDFIERTRKINQQALQEQAAGRDRLLELNSFQPERGRELIAEIQQLEHGQSLAAFMQQAWDHFGIEEDSAGPDITVLHPGAHMLISHFPGLPDEGLKFTFQRQLALQREDLQFLNWHHPLIKDTLDLILQGDYGKTAVSIMPKLPAQKGKLLLHCLYRINLNAPPALQAPRFLEADLIEVLMDENAKDFLRAFQNQQTSKLKALNKQEAAPLIKHLKEDINAMAEAAGQAASSILSSRVSAASRLMLKSLGGEIKRLVALARHNPNIREEEIEHLRARVLALHKTYEQASLQLEAVHLIICA